MKKVFHTQDEYKEDVDQDLNASNNLKCPSLILMFWTLQFLQTWIQLSRFFNLVSFLPMGRNLTSLSHIFFVYCSDHPFSPLCRPTGPTQYYVLAQGSGSPTFPYQAFFWKSGVGSLKKMLLFQMAIMVY